MIFYLIKTIACSAVLLLVYIYWLRQEKMHRFNRFYLLGSLVFSFLVPLFSIETTKPVTVVNGVSQATEETITVINSATTEFVTNHSQSFPWFTLLLAVYVAVSAFLLARFTRNMIKLYGRIKKYRSIKYETATLVLLPWATVPHSFLQYIFLSEEKYQQGTIQKEIWEHELTHVTQRHSIDIIITELLQVFLWFNPLLVIYQKMIRVNHEFLADEAVIKKGADARGYQYLLVTPQHSMVGTFPASAFNYAVTKKRLLMISKTTSPLKALVKQMTVILPASALFLFCCIKTVAQDTTPPQVKGVQPAPSTAEGVSGEMLAEYQVISEKIINGKKPATWPYITELERARLETIFVKMSKEQQARQRISFIKNFGPSARSVPTEKQLEAWKNGKIYGLWIDNKRVPNSVLEKYKITDFSNLSVSKLAKNTVNYGKHYYQVNLMTNEHYETYRKNQLEDMKKHPLLMVMSWISKENK